MTAALLDGRALAAKTRARLAVQIKSAGTAPGLVFLSIEGDEAARSYGSGIGKACKEVGIVFHSEVFPTDVAQEDFIERLHAFNDSEEIHGILIQSPLPGGFDFHAISAAISVDKDVDGIHPFNRGLLLSGEAALSPCTPSGIVRLLEESNIPLQGKHAVILGRSTTVGLPLALRLIRKDATVTVCHSKTPNLPEITRQAAILVAAVGKPGWVKSTHVKPGAVVVDVGIHEINGRIIGDVDFADVSKTVAFITPVPGGVGPMTVAALLENTFSAFSMHPKKAI